MPGLKIETLPPVKGRTLIIGDVHGCADELKRLIKAFKPGPEDRMIAVGDLINRGPDSRRVLKLARKYSIHPILGNHEQRLLRAWQNKDKSLLKKRDLPTFNDLKKKHFEWMLTWPHILHVPSLNILVVHGGLDPGTAWQDQDPLIATHIQVLDKKGQPAKRTEAPKGRPWADYWNGPEHVIYGHTPRPHPIFHALATGLDTGCVYGFQLSALCLPGFDLYKVQSKRAYADD